MQKIFEIGDDSRFGLCTWGNGKVGETSHRTIAALAGDRVKLDSTLDDVADMIVSRSTRLRHTPIGDSDTRLPASIL